MKKILFIGGKIYPLTSANTINSINIMEELIKRGHNVDYISLNQDEEIFKINQNMEIYPIKSTKYGELLELSRNRTLNKKEFLSLKVLFFIRKIKNFINIIKFPDVDPSQSKKAFKLAKKLHKEKNFDCIIGIFRPFSGVSSSILMKKKYPEILCGAYYLDLINGSVKPSFVPNKLYKYLCYFGETRAFKKLDFILMAKGGKKIYNDAVYDSINSKIRYIGFPLLKKNILKENINYNNKNINIVYAGTLNKSYRNPEYVLEILELISKNIGNIVLHIYGHGDCNDVIKKYKNKSLYKIIEYGKVSHDKVVSAIQGADFVINISNSTQNIVPSKIFELFSTGKPILNLINNKKDISKVYFDKYPSVFNMLEWSDIKKQSINLEKFIRQEKGKFYPIELLQKQFIENTPEFTADIIEEKLYKRRK